MATSSIFYRFRSQKDPSRITFDGPFNTVFELKKDIIAQNKLGEGTDFELRLYNEEGEEYEDDTTQVSRSSTVIARRSPARVHGRGGAARYVSGRMPVNAKNTPARPEAALSAPTNGMSGGASGGDEEDNLTKMFSMQANATKMAQDNLQSNAMPFKRPINKADIPDKPPPPGYVCYRCGDKGHWIQACPTNNDPNYVSQPRFKRTTGIPKSMLVKVNREEIEADDERPAGLMLSAEGEWVMAKSDYEEFQKYQAKVRQSKVAQQEEKQGNKELQDKGLECPLDKRLFVDPVKTPCCSKTYCGGCINNALTDNDLHCPNCKEEILFDDLSPDEEKRAAIRAYETDRSDRAKEQAAASAAAHASALAAEIRPDEKPAEAATQADEETDSVDRNGSLSPNSKKRKAESQLESNRAAPPPTAPKGPASQQQQQNGMPIAGGPMGPNAQNMMGAQMPGMQMVGQWPMGMPMMPGMAATGNMNGMQWQGQGQHYGGAGNGYQVANANGGGNWQNGQGGQGGRGGQQGGTGRRGRGRR